MWGALRPVGLSPPASPSRPGGDTMRATSWIIAAALAAAPPADARELVKKSDTQIKARVEASLEADDALHRSRIFVQSVNDGVVLLAGKARNTTDDLRAMADAARVPGVRRIVSEIRSPDGLADEEISREREPPKAARDFGVAATRDTWVTLATKLRLLADRRTPARDISVDTLDGAVTLFGMVPSVETKAAAEENARKVRGAKRVVNRLQVVPPSRQEAVKARDQDAERAVRRALDGRPELRDARIDVDVKNGVARLSGTVPTEEQRLSAGRAARAAAGVRSVEDDLRISSRPWSGVPGYGGSSWEEGRG